VHSFSIHRIVFNSAELVLNIRSSISGVFVELRDTSCTFDTPQWEDFGSAPRIGTHSIRIDENTGTEVSEVFERTEGEQKAAELKKVSVLSAPNSEKDMDWSRLEAVKSTWAQTVFRVETSGGQPPSSCFAGDPSISLPYHAQYCE
jgi:hypothetical protein